MCVRVRERERKREEAVVIKRQSVEDFWNPDNTAGKSIELRDKYRREVEGRRREVEEERKGIRGERLKRGEAAEAAEKTRKRCHDSVKGEQGQCPARRGLCCQVGRDTERGQREAHGSDSLRQALPGIPWPGWMTITHNTHNSSLSPVYTKPAPHQSHSLTF